MLLKRHPWKIVIGVLAVVAIVTMGLNPLRWPDFAVHGWLLRSVPVGSSQSHLLEVAKTNGWRVNGSWPGHQPHSDWGGIDGATVVWVYLGEYQGLLRTDLDSFWAYDEKGNLADVRIRRMMDGP
jgi:hypothetical protein